MSERYLAFVDYVGTNSEGKYIYRFDFTEDVYGVWGEYFNIVPTTIVPNLQPDENTIVSSARVDFEHKLFLAKQNGCFSMQDCFDGIIPLAFTEIDEDNTYYYDDTPLYFNFGEDFALVESKINFLGYHFYNISEKDNKEEIIDELIENISDENKNGSYLSDETSEYSEIVSLKIGDITKIDYLNTLLFDNGFERKDYVSKEGEYSIRGNIFDIFSYNESYPFRVCFFGNEIESISKFNETEQTEIDKLNEITIYKTTKHGK